MVSDESELPFAPVDGKSPASEVTQQIRTAILDGVLTSDERLPPERQLADLFQVSRGTLRDALRTLQTHGLLRVRVGAKGGTFVTAPGPDYLKERVAHMLALSELSAGEVTEARVILELGALSLVCERRTDDDLDALTTICDAAEAALADGTHTFQYSVDFHIHLAKASHSRATETIIESLHEPLLRSMVAASLQAPRMAPQGAREHRQIVEAIRDRDAERARAVLGAHLGRTLERVGADPGLVAGQL